MRIHVLFRQDTEHAHYVDTPARQTQTERIQVGMSWAGRVDEDGEGTKDGGGRVDWDRLLATNRGLILAH